MSDIEKTLNALYLATPPAVAGDIKKVVELGMADKDARIERLEAAVEGIEELAVELRGNLMANKPIAALKVTELILTAVARV
jgi:hypothetical protein